MLQAVKELFVPAKPKTGSEMIASALSAFQEAADKLEDAIGIFNAKSREQEAKLEAERRRLAELEQITQETMAFNNKEIARAGRALDKINEILGD